MLFTIEAVKLKTNVLNSLFQFLLKRLQDVRCSVCQDKSKLQTYSEENRTQTNWSSMSEYWIDFLLSFM